MKQKKYCGKITIAIIMLEIMVSSIGILSGFLMKVNKNDAYWDNLIYPKIEIAAIEVGGKTKAEAANLIKEQYLNKLMSKEVNVFGNDKKYIIEVSNMINSDDLDYVLDQAANYGKNLDIFSKNHMIKNGANKKYSVSFTYNAEYLNNIITEIEKDFQREPVNAAIEKSPDSELKFKNSINGLKIDRTKLERSVIDEINKEDIDDKTLKVPSEEILPSITLDKIENINTKISSFSTNFTTSSFSRINNIIRASEFINGKIIMPGEDFSFNDVVGERTKARGFTEAPIIIDRDFKSGLGGGICQVSTTLYNAVLEAGINSTERKPHTIPATYVGLGLDATVDWNNIDFKFKNNLLFPIYIESYTKDRRLYINIYSNSSLADKKYTITNNVERVDKSKGTYNVKVYRNTIINEHLVEKKLISNDYYFNVK